MGLEKNRCIKYLHCQIPTEFINVFSTLVLFHELCRTWKLNDYNKQGLRMKKLLCISKHVSLHYLIKKERTL